MLQNDIKKRRKKNRPCNYFRLHRSTKQNSPRENKPSNNSIRCEASTRGLQEESMNPLTKQVTVPAWLFGIYVFNTILIIVNHFAD